jgi:hypothetical protein
MSRLCFALICTGMILPSLLLAPPAHADPVSNYAAIVAPAVCTTLDTYPTVAGVTGVLAGVVEDSGFSYYDAGQIVATAVIDECPRHLPLLQKFIAVYAPKSRVTA